MGKIRILIVDDAVMVRRKVSEILSADPALEVVGVAANGHIALAKIPQVNPDIVVLDVEMPEMDGLQTLAEIRKTYPQLPTIMLSAFTERGATATLEALSLGAKDYVTKPFKMDSIEAANEHLRQKLIPKIKVFCAEKLEAEKLSLKASDFGMDCLSSCPRDRPSDALTSPIKPYQLVELVAIGVSTGGPSALATLISQLPATFPVPMVIVQHMPPLFTQRLAERLAATCKIQVAEAFNGAELTPGKVWIAPGDFHTIVVRTGTHAYLQTHREPPENSCRPSVDVLFRSVAKTYGGSAIAVVLTGMGQDGLRGCQRIHEVGGRIFVQDQASSIVWGMPGFVAKAGLAEKVLPLEEIAKEIQQAVAV